MKNKLEDLLKQPVSWLSDEGPEDDIVISTRMRLARNIQDMSFPAARDIEKLQQVREMAVKAIYASDSIVNPMEFNVAGMTETEKQFLLERRLISRDFMKGGPESVLISAKDESLAVMVNEEDHLRIQALSAGFQLRSVWERINAFDDILSQKLPYAFDEQFGFLTACPSNLGTGLRASVMVHIPGLVLTNQVSSMSQGLSKLGLAVRGFYGEGSENLGNLFQISNQSTLGEREEQIIDRLSSMIEQVILQEKKARQDLLEQKQNFLMNHVGRSYGVLRYSWLISAEEALNDLSALRLGVDMGMFSTMNIHMVNELFMLVQPSHLMLHEKRELDQSERDAVRAGIIRETLKAQRDR